MISPLHIFSLLPACLPAPISPSLLCGSNSIEIKYHFHDLNLQPRKNLELWGIGNQSTMPSSIRLLKMFNLPDIKEMKETKSPLDELEESEVVWSSSGYNSGSESHPPTPLFTSSSELPSQFDAGAGISAAIGSGDRGRPLCRSPVVQRKKTAISPLISAPYTSLLSRSAPLKVPIWTDGRGVKSMGRFDEEEEEGFEDDDDEEMVPPHEMVARSHRTTSFSVVEGVGRTLKGRDLSTVRNAVMQKTGFLD